MKDLGILLLIFIFIIYNIYFNETFFTLKLPNIEFNKNINTYISSLDNKTLKQIPDLKYISRKNCPIMYKFFMDIESDTNMERIEALRIRNKIQSVFFNTDEIIRAEYQIINISKLEQDEDENFNIPNFEFNYLLADNIKLKYIEDTDKHLKLSQKETFGVEGNFDSRDIMNFMEYCFTILTYKMIPINKLILNNAAMYVSKCEICNNKSAFNIVPVRIVQQCLKEEKEFTRAKCTMCCSNILVYFKSPPNKYLSYKKLVSEKINKIEEINFE